MHDPPAEFTPPDDFLDAPPAAGDGLPRGNGLLAWVVIVGMILVVIGLRMLGGPPEPEPGAEPATDTIGLAMAELQSKYAVASTGFAAEQGDVVMESMESILDTGTLDQRQRFVVTTAEIVGPAAARERLEMLEDLIDEPPEGAAPTLTRDQQRTQELLARLYPADILDLPDDQAEEITVSAAATLTPDDRAVLEQQLGWAGTLAALPRGTAEQEARDEVLSSATAVMFTFLLLFILMVGAIVVGLGGLITFLVTAARKRLRSGMGQPRTHHRVYAETFAVWSVVFFGLQIAALAAPAEHHMFVAALLFLASLVSLAWPVWRGIPWTQVRQDIGLTAGRKPLMEPLIGLAAYLSTLPLLAVGVLMVLLLMLIQGVFAAAVGDTPSTFAPVGGPSHPIVSEASGATTWLKIQILLLASFAAPIVEEIMFRGVLYRHLRDTTAAWGVAGSALISALLGGFIFAVVHPQGLVAVPALMALAVGMALVREWRGTLIPSMVLHATSNAIVMLMLLVLFNI